MGLWGGLGRGGCPTVDPPLEKLILSLHLATELLAMANENSSNKAEEAVQLDLAEAIKKWIPVLRVTRLSEKAMLPERMFPQSAAYDLFSAADTVVPARGKAKVPTDLSIEFPPGTYGRIAGRSSRAWRYSLQVGAGVVDLDKDPVFVILFNHADTDYEVKVGERIAQLVVELHATPEIVEYADTRIAEFVDSIQKLWSKRRSTSRTSVPSCQPRINTLSMKRMVTTRKTSAQSSYDNPENLSSAGKGSSWGSPFSPMYSRIRQQITRYTKITDAIAKKERRGGSSTPENTIAIAREEVWGRRE
nr:deoxyuridine 5'-triphosphate nucleotidohydrolase-like [Ipomoea batatas]